MAVILHFPSYLETESSIDLSDTTVTENVILSGYKAYDKNGSLITGTIVSKNASTYTPTTSDIIIDKGFYLNGNQIIKGDINLIASNIKKGVTIFNIAGTYDNATYTIYDGETTITPSSVSQTLETKDKVVQSNIVVLGDENLKASNIKKGVTIFGVEGTLEGGQTAKDDIKIINLSQLTSTSDIVSACNGLVEISSDGSLETFSPVAAYNYDSNPIGAYYAGGQGGGIYYASANRKNSAIFFNVPVKITSSKLLLKLVYFVSAWINPTMNFYFVSASSDTEAKEKIKNNEIDYNYSFVFANSNNSKSSFYEINNLPTGEYYVCVNAEAGTGGNEAILEDFYIIGL